MSKFSISFLFESENLSILIKSNAASAQAERDSSRLKKRTFSFCFISLVTAEDTRHGSEDACASISDTGNASNNDGKIIISIAE